MGVLLWWLGLGVFAALATPQLAQRWPGWPWAVASAAVWGFNLILLVYGIGPPFRVSRPPFLAASFALLMTAIGSGNYWATLQLYPAYRVDIEYAAWFVAVCTAATLAAVVGMQWLRQFRSAPVTPRRLHWDWSRLSAVTYLLFLVSAVGTVATVVRIGYVPILAGDPTSARVEFPVIGGIWYRLSMLGGVVALLVGVHAAARRATLFHYMIGLLSLGLVGVYGPRFFVALPLGVSLILWDRTRSPLPLGRVVLLLIFTAPVVAIVGLWRARDQNAMLLGSLGLLLYGALGEFRDLAWALGYYGFGDRLLHGGTFGSVVVPLLPTPVWQVVGIDKAGIYAHSSASALADAMGQTTGQRIGVYGEFFINFGWTGALLGAALYGVLLAYLDSLVRDIDARHVRGIFLMLTAATAVFALIGQLDMFTSTLTGFGYPLGLVALIASRRRNATGIPQA